MENVGRSGLRQTCGEGIYPRWVAKRPQNLTSRCARLIESFALGLLRNPAGINPLATKTAAGSVSSFTLGTF